MSGEAQEARSLDSVLVAILGCPQCGGRVEAKSVEGRSSRERAAQQSTPSQLTCGRCNLVYSVENGIPVMLVDRARSLEDGPGRDAPESSNDGGAGRRA